MICNLLKNVWHALPARVFTGNGPARPRVPVPHPRPDFFNKLTGRSTPVSASHRRVYEESYTRGVSRLTATRDLGKELVLMLTWLVPAALYGCTSMSPNAPERADQPESGETVQGNADPWDTFESPIGLPTGILQIGDEVFHVEIAATPTALETGLMDRTHVEANAGMLFVFDQPELLRFWMVKTPLPLDVAFIDPDWTIVGMATMEPLSGEIHESPIPAQYALEVAAGEFARRGIAVGDTVTPPDL